MDDDDYDLLNDSYLYNLDESIKGKLNDLKETIDTKVQEAHEAIDQHLLEQEHDDNISNLSKKIKDLDLNSTNPVDLREDKDEIIEFDTLSFEQIQDDLLIRAGYLESCDDEEVDIP